MSVGPEHYRAFRRRLRDLEESGQVYRQRKGRYGLPESFALVVGRLEIIRSGDGFAVPEEAGAEDVFVPARSLGTAVEDDQVVVQVVRRRRGRNPEGRVVRVLHRAWTQVVGLYHTKRGYGLVTPQEPRLRSEVFVPSGMAGQAADGCVVLVEVRDWGDDDLRPVGEITRVLGRPGDPGVDVLSVLLGHQLPLDFPEEVLKAARRLARRGVRPEDLTGREDFRDLMVFTVDPADARDHDDAVSVRVLPEGILEVGIHIADVSYYVKPGSELDREALERGTSVYLVDRAIPMLPEQLSGDLCSLVVGADRLTISVIFHFDGDGTVEEHRVVRGVIRSRRGLSYEEAQELLVRAESEERTAGSGLDATAGSPSGERDLGNALVRLAAVSRSLRQKRSAAGAIDFAVPEPQVLLDEVGRPTAIRKRQRLETHRIIEDLMILTNEAVACHGIEQGLTLVFRNHEEPDEDKIENLRDLATVFGYSLPGGRVRPADLARLIRDAEGTPQEYLISTVALRSMKQARYSTRNVGHFGLASSAYLHFTSPIRRYPDLAVHREVVRWMGGRTGQSLKAEETLEATARHSSERERRAEAAERESVELKQIEYMQRHVGDDFEGTISGVTTFGLFVLLDGCMVEGLIRMSSLLDDYYTFDAEKHALLGRRTRRRLRLGDRVAAQVVRVDTEKRHVDLELRPLTLDRQGREG